MAHRPAFNGLTEVDFDREAQGASRTFAGRANRRCLPDRACVRKEPPAMASSSHAMSTRLRALALYKDLLRLGKDYPDPA